MLALELNLSSILKADKTHEFEQFMILLQKKILYHGETIGKVKRSTNTNVFTLTYTNGQETDLSFIYNPEGFKLLNPLFINNTEVKNFEWSPTADEAGVFTCIDENASIVIEGYYPENYMYYSDFLGDYNMTYAELEFDKNNNPYFNDVETNAYLKRKVDNKTYTLSGMPYAMTDLEISYDRATGSIAYNTGTQVSVYNGYYLYQTVGTSSSYMPSYVGYSFTLDGVIEQSSPLKVAFKDTGWGIYYFGEPVTSIIVDAYSTSTPLQSSFSGFAQWYRDVVLTKKDN